ncbi:MAG: hypothetical protein KY395_02910, partial [Actinobacteria bacterium]|nr:hypothetical protein [Actinomycetota bacterium]
CRIIADAVTEGRFIAERRGGSSVPVPTEAPPRPPARLVTEDTAAGSTPVQHADDHGMNRPPPDHGESSTTGPPTTAGADGALPPGEESLEPDPALSPEEVRTAQEETHDSRHDPSRNDPSTMADAPATQDEGSPEEPPTQAGAQTDG